MTNRHPLRSGMLYASWAASLVRRRRGRLAATAAGIALAVGLLASLVLFLSASKASMTERAIDTVAVDWQVEVQSGADPAQVAAQVAASPHIVASETVLVASTTGLQRSSATTQQTTQSTGLQQSSATTQQTTQSTGPGRVLGISDTYRSTFPAQFRDLAGSSSGVLLFQQTAANLAAKPGDTFTIGRAGLTPVTVTVSGVVDIPQADSLFQTVGAPAGSQAQAPPDNVVVLPAPIWHQLFDPLAADRPEAVQTQIHTRLDHQLAGDPCLPTTTSPGRPATSS